MIVKIMALTQNEMKEINPEVWVGQGKRGLLKIPPVTVEMVKDTPPVRVKQYPISLEGREGLAPVIRQLLEEEVLEPCMSPHNTPILAVRKADGSYQPVQDLREVNKKTISRHPVVPDPYTLLSKVPREHQWFTTIDLKDAFGTCPLAEESRDWFAFEWDDPTTRRKQQLRWTHLPQGFSESPNLFGQSLEKLLEQSDLEEGVQILQYVDDLLISGESQSQVKNTSIRCLNFLGEQGLKVSQGKLQFVEPEVKFLGHLIGNGYKKLSPERISGILSIESPKTRMNGETARNRWHILSKLLDPVARGWPVCLQAVAATAVLLEEAQRLTLHGKIKVHTPHDLRTVLSQQAQQWLTDARILKYEIILMNADNLEIATSKCLNPAQFLSGEPLENLEHDCIEFISLETKVREDLEDKPLPHGEVMFIDGSSRMTGGMRVSGHAVVDGRTMRIIEKGKLPSNWSAQSCELYALKRGLELLEENSGTIYTDSRYAFGVVHIFGKIWEERGYINSKGKNIIHERLIKLLLEALQKPAEIAIVHIKGHQRGNTLEVRGNRIADQAAKEATLGLEDPVKSLHLREAQEQKEGDMEPIYSEKEKEAIEELGLHQE
ncbi:LOW QUALITY PROTEIN: uncharacterized protein LOC111926435 [Cyanistes caeruleus]|uniref:LOW QUALITY PROTEIN: uncharacterized protein LOC111926435 n=1 Tax=Cyanistes caeruleus TaxID=156563 RepID=UPI000CDB1611|nr:LOW QUALITY PROTEIN: uncharacterized protein LOC111926435 [Cyanistes caeruleus]